MSWVVVVHTDPAALVAELERAGLVVEEAGELTNCAFVAAGTNQRRGYAPPPPRSVLVVSNPAAREKAA